MRRERGVLGLTLLVILTAACGGEAQEEAETVDEAQMQAASPSGTPEIPADFPFESHYVEVFGSRLHYIDEGSGDPMLFLHGNPTSSYLWRNVIPHVTGSARAVALDLVGMGRSDKPEIEYRFLDHASYVEGFIDALELENITLVVHDWGSGLGFYYAMRNPDNIKAIAFMEPILAPVPSWDDFPAEFRELFQTFRTPDAGWDLIVNQNVFVEQVLPGAVIRPLSEQEMNAYREPYVDPASRKPVWRWPNELPIAGEPAEVVEAVSAYNRWLQESDHPKLLFFAAPGAIMRAPLVEWCRQNIKNLTTVDLGEGIHFLQEDHPHVIGSELAEWYESLPVAQ